MSKDSSRSLAGVAALLETVRPIVQKAASDPEFHGALKQAFAVGKEVNQQVSGKPPSAIARKLAYDRRLQRKVENSAIDLQKAVAGLVEPPKRKRRIRGAITKIIIVGAAAGAVIVVLRRVRGGGGDDEVIDAEL
jgi:hypothetical protein